MQQLELEDGLLDRIVNKVNRDTFGYFYLFFDQGIQRYDGENFTNISSVQLNNIDLSLVDNVKRDKEGGIQFSILESNFQIPPGSTQVKKIPKQKVQSSTPDTISQFRIEDRLYTISEGTIWLTNDKVTENIAIETDPNLYCHMLKQDKEGNFIALFAYNFRTTERILVIKKDGQVLDYSSLLSYGNNIRDIYCEDVESKWLLATFNGIVIFNFSNAGIENFHVRKNVKKSQFGNIITSVNAETGRTIFLKETHGLRELKANNEVELLFEDQAEFFHQNQQLIYDKYHQNFYSYSYDLNGKFELHEFNLQNETADINYIPLRIRDLYNLDENHLLIGGHKIFNEKNEDSGCIIKYNKKNKTREKILKDIPAILDINYIKSTEEFWLGTQYGIYIYDNQFQLKETLGSDVNSGDKYLAHSEIRTIIEFNDYMIAGSYNGGVYIIDKSTKQLVKNINEANGLSDNAAVAMSIDSEDNIWVATFNGLTVLNENFEIIDRFYEYDGLPNREFNTRAVDQDIDGNIYFGTLNGLVKIDPIKLLKRKTTHGLHFENLEVHKDNTTQTFNNLNNLVKTYSNYDSIQLTFNYPDFYKYRFDDWNSSLSIDENLNQSYRIKDGSITLGKLPKGAHNYLFSNTSNSSHQELKIEITQDNRKIFGIAGLALLIFSIGYLIFRYRISELKKLEADKTKINTQIAELELTALRSQMNPHFIFNALGSVQYFIQTQETEKADSYLSNFAMLMRKILESSKSKFISLHEETELIKLYIGLEKMRFEKLFEYEIIIDPLIDLENPIPPMIIQPFIENAINHGLYHLECREGKLVIHFRYVNENKIQCIISDNGIGRKAALKYRKPKHKSRGLEIVNERIQTINNKAGISASIETKDLTEGHTAKGTQVIISLEYEE